MPEGRARLTLCGFGLHLRQLTLETVDALQGCDAVYTDALDEPSLQPLKAYCADVRVLEEAATTAKVERVLQTVAEGKDIVVLNYGHATFLSSLAQGLIAACRERGVSYRILNAVSSLDAVLASLEATTLWSGLHVYDADDFGGLIGVIPLQPAVPTVIVKAGYLLKPAQKDRLTLFLDRLGAFYPPDHPVVLLVSPWIFDPKGKRTEVPLRKLRTALKGPDEFVTLYLPPVAARVPDSSPATRPVATDTKGDAGLSGALETGRILLQKDDLAAAEAHFDGLLAGAPDWVEALAWRACCRLRRRAVGSALEDLDRCVSLRPAPEWHYQLRAEAHLAARNPKAALADLEKAELWEHRQDWTQVLGAAAAAQSGDWNGAAAALRLAAKLNRRADFGRARELVPRGLRFALLCWKARFSLLGLFIF